jgi:hypothetical protein
MYFLFENFEEKHDFMNPFCRKCYSMRPTPTKAFKFLSLALRPMNSLCSRNVKALAMEHIVSASSLENFKPSSHAPPPHVIKRVTFVCNEITIELDIPIGI